MIWEGVTGESLYVLANGFRGGGHASSRVMERCRRDWAIREFFWQVPNREDFGGEAGGDGMDERAWKHSSVGWRGRGLANNVPRR